MHTLSLKSEYEDMVISQAEEALPVANENDAMQIFTYKEIATATKNFSEDCILGSDECGRVYKGELQEVNEIVAIKQLQRNGNQGENEFFGDVVKLSFLHHPNLVKLLGYCSEEDQISLVYEYIPFGSLQNHLFGIFVK
ncbi:probable serine/threonine-protein kinase PBL25 [Phalaenopsis equestris]|uniref:probable serine/threonine-protein kinase PBL25 n=1 Tax=Phalaenopsis equestris TaxID=78828 RepID=UPI0009E5819E|nr:probable serine/threonine-protein kinase PBL25 [Phalaenopsis equestris]